MVDAPRAQRIGPIAAHSVLTMNHSESCMHLKNELTGRIKYVDDQILGFLLGANGTIAEDSLCADHPLVNCTEIWNELLAAPHEDKMHEPLVLALHLLWRRTMS